MPLALDYSFYQIDLPDDCRANRQLLLTLTAAADADYPATHSIEETVDMMQKLDAGMRYGVMFQNMQEAENFMRRQSVMLENVSAEGKPQQLELFYFRMEFLRINALLYANYQKPQKAADYYSQAAELASLLTEELKHQEYSRSFPEIEFVAWSACEIFREAGVNADQLMDMTGHHTYTKQCAETMKRFLPYMNDGWRSEAADFLSQEGAILVEQGAVEEGCGYFTESIRLLQKLAKENHLPVMEAKKIWTESRLLAAVSAQGDFSLLVPLEQEISEFLSRQEGENEKYLIGIVKGARATLLQVKSLTVQEASVDKALDLLKTGHEDLEEALEILKADCAEQGPESYRYHFLQKIAGAAYMGKILNAWGQGLLYMQAERYGYMIDALEKCLQTIQDDPYNLSPYGLSIFRANCYYYLSFCSVTRDNIDDMEFYGKKCLEETEDLLRGSFHPLVMSTRIQAAALLAQSELIIKNKSAAEHYSQLGLEAVDAARQSDGKVPPDLLDEMEKALRTILKKSKKRFFF